LDYFRRSYASLIIQITKDLHYAKEQLGLSSIKVTIDIYGHILTPEWEERTVDILDNLAIGGL
jgi:integrase